MNGRLWFAESGEYNPGEVARLIARLDEWAGRSKSGYYDEAQGDVIEILRPFRSAK